MMAQYLDVKRAHPDCLLFYRMGDFFELFFEDAVAAAKALDIALTQRGKHDGVEVPMCGVPVHSHEVYLARLIRQGYKVALCDQVEDAAVAKKRGGKTLVRRAVVRVLTPGTLTEDQLLDTRRANYLAALTDVGGALGLAWLDMSTGEFFVEPVEPARLAGALARLDPRELLLPDRLLQREGLYETWADWKERLTPLPGSRFDSENGRLRLEKFYGVAALDGFGAFGRPEWAAMGALLDYIELTQKGRLPRIAPPRRFNQGSVLEIDAATRRNLELVESLSGERRGCLLAAIDRTLTGAGARLLAARIAAPLTDPEEIGHRLDAVQFFAEAERLRQAVRERLSSAPDIGRALTRLTLARGGPRDLAAIRDGLEAALAIRRTLVADGLAGPPEPILAAMRALEHHEVLIERLAASLATELPLQARDGGFIAKGVAPELDELRLLRDESRRHILNLEAAYRAETGVASLKVRHNNVLGYYVEVTPAHADKFPIGVGHRFIHRQTLAGAVRFTTLELSELESKILTAADKALAVELALFEALASEVIGRAGAIAAAAEALAALDLAAGLAELAVERRWSRPLVDRSLAFHVEGGRHPVVETALEATGSGPFAPNDCDLAEDRRLWLLTGPNMAGKSTFLRQNALIAILAQTGSFVPAAAAHIGVVDRLFSRVGAADDLARGRSTFMVEMVETAAILNQAGARSFVILDEIGRGTATFDGLSIAWACLEHLHEVNRARALFATHYHELTLLAAKLPALKPHTMRIKEWQGGIVFLHEVAPGAADRSYGIHVAKLAGLPASVIARAEAVLDLLERGDQAGALARLADDLPLFSMAARAATPVEPSALEAVLAGLNPDELTPKEALEALYRLKRLLRNP
ncbi:MAG TPA: DNA mismatch repair protein MutS [Alphaproteobacteria bacterium]|nr:DNA mismatch repair protein MutS [Alphaproteobacteria bacterium]